MFQNVIRREDLVEIFFHRKDYREKEQNSAPTMVKAWLIVSGKLP